MKGISRLGRILGGRRAQDRAAALRRRFARATARRQPRNRSQSWKALSGLLIVAVAVALAAWALTARLPATASHWSFNERLRHILAAPNCDAARAMGLAPARRGAPGYYQRHDADRDGIACEPFPRAH